MFLTPPAIQESTPSVVQTELEAMYKSDQQGRAELFEAQKKHGPFSAEVIEIIKKQKLVDDKNQQRLVEIVDQIGWPKMSVVGEKAAQSAFLILQHSGLDLQKRYLPLLRKAAATGETKLQWLALLEDRVLVGEGKKQLYGSQLIERKGVTGIQLQPIEDEANVDERRAKMGLGPLAEYLKGFGIEYQKPTQHAPNL